MNKRAAIAADLVDVRNIGFNKSIKLTLHVPAERAAEVMAAFGWPTAVDPVPVALARLNAQPASEPEPPVRARKPVAPEKRLAQQAGILCADPVFQRFLFEHDILKHPNVDPEDAATAIRLICHVETRADILPGTPAAAEWDRLLSKFTAWKLAA